MAAAMALAVAVMTMVAPATAVAPADGHSSCSISATADHGSQVVTCETWASAQSLTGLTLAPPQPAEEPPLFVDVQAVAYSLPAAGTAPPRNATIASIVSGAANKHNISADEAVAMAIAASKASPTPLDLVLFPECFLYDGDNAEFCGVYAATGKRWDCNGPHVSVCRRVALATKAYVVCPFYELAQRNASQDTGPSFNTAVLLDRRGAVVGKYRKSYPTSEIFGSPAGELDEGILPGNLGVPTFDTDFGRVAILVCWDCECWPPPCLSVVQFRRDLLSRPTNWLPVSRHVSHTVLILQSTFRSCGTLPPLAGRNSCSGRRQERVGRRCTLTP
jgi:predicted amidohydrolase